MKEKGREKTFITDSETLLLTSFHIPNSLHLEHVHWMCHVYYTLKLCCFLLYFASVLSQRASIVLISQEAVSAISSLLPWQCFIF